MKEIPFDHLGSSDLVVDALYQGGTRGNAGDDPISRLVPVGNMGGFRYAGSSSTTIRLCVLYSELSDPDWPDGVFPELGRFVYFGDNKTPGHELHDTPRKGNLILRDCFEAFHAGRRDRVPPFLVFTKAGTGRDVMFRGLAVPGAPGLSSSDDLVAVWRTRANKRFQNYRATFTFLDVPVVPRTWLTSLASGTQDDPDILPPAWQKWIALGRFETLLAPRVRGFRTQAEQLPTDSGEVILLSYLHGYFSDHPEGPFAFEKCAAELVKLMDGNVVSVDVTRPWRDGGRDALGKYRIGTRGSALKVDFALEAKCKKPSPKNTSGVRETSRLVSRLRHRQFGIFLTTSCLARQAYEELVEDEHPVLVLSGKDSVDILKGAGIDSETKLEAWLTSIAPKGPS